MNSGGISCAGGIGRALSEWIANSELSLSLPLFSFSILLPHTHTGEPPFDLWEFDITRFSPHTANKNYLSDRAQEILGRHYCQPWPRWELESGRGVKKTPFHSRLEAEGASFGCVYGWERPNWFAREGGEYMKS